MTWWQLCIVILVGGVSLRLVIDGLTRHADRPADPAVSRPVQPTDRPL